MTDFPTLRDLLEEAVRAEPRDHVFTRWYEGGAWHTRTYAETLERVRALSEWFGAQGLTPRETHVALLLPNSPAWLEAYLAIIGLAGAVVPIDPKLTPAELHHILSDSGAALLVTDAPHLKTLAGALPTLPALRATLVVGEAPEGLPIPVETLAHALESLAPDVPLRFWDAPEFRPTPDDLCAILYTSGTTGKPKGAMLTHRNFTADAIGALRLISGYVTPHDDFLVVLPLFHAFAFTANFVVALRAHATLSFIRSLRTLSDDFRHVRPTVLMAVPLMAEKLHARLMEGVRATLWGRLLHRLLPRVVGRRVLAGLGGRLRLTIVGGAKADQTILRDFNRMGLPMSEGYGLTECAPVVSVCPPSASASAPSARPSAASRCASPPPTPPAWASCKCAAPSPSEATGTTPPPPKPPTTATGSAPATSPPSTPKATSPSEAAPKPSSSIAKAKTSTPRKWSKPSPATPSSAPSLSSPTPPKANPARKLAPSSPPTATPSPASTPVPPPKTSNASCATPSSANASPSPPTNTPAKSSSPTNPSPSPPPKKSAATSTPAPSTTNPP